MAYRQMTILNENLIKTQCLSDEEVEELHVLHKTKDDLFQLMKKTSDSNTLKLYAKLLTSLEFDMQRVWKFPQSINYHTWWYHSPKCLCPTMDNQDNFGTEFAIINAECPLHGFEK